LIFTGGQADLDEHGVVLNPGKLEIQTQNVLQHTESILIDLDASLDNVVKLLVYFTGDEEDEKNIIRDIAERLSEHARPVISTVCLPALCYPGMRIELEAVAIDPLHCNTSNPEYKRHDALPALHPQFSHVVRCNDLLFVGDMSAINSVGDIQAEDNVIEQTRLMLSQLDRALGLFDQSAADVLKLNVFYLGDGTAENWAEPAAIRADFFPDPGPAATGIAVSGFAKKGLMTKISVVAKVGDKDAGNPLPTTQYAWPQGHWNWTTPLPYKHGNRFGHIIHLGGQVALDMHANVLQADNMVEQTKIALKNISTVLADLGASMDDIVKVTTFYQGAASAEDLHKNLVIRSSAFRKPGPATSGIPVPHLVYQHMLIEIEVIAMVEFL